MTIKERAKQIGISNPNELQMLLVQKGGRVTQRTTRGWWNSHRKPQYRNRILLAVVLRIPLVALEKWWAKPAPKMFTCKKCGVQVPTLSVYGNCRKCEIDFKKGG